MHIAVIGASSFSGRAFCEVAVEHGAEVVRLSRPEFDLNTNMRGIMRAISANLCDYVVNYAALNMVGESWQHAADYMRTNALAVTTLADALSKYGGLRKYLHVSTPEIYGPSAEVAIRETTHYQPSTPYAVSRAAADMQLIAYHNTYGLPVCFTRTVNVYGPGQQPYRIIPKTVLCCELGSVLQLHGGGTSARSFIHVRDMAEAAWTVLTKGNPGEAYHASGPEEITIFALVERIIGMIGARFRDVVVMDEDRPGKDRLYRLDDSKLRGLGWEPKIGLDKGLRETVNWFRERAGRYTLEQLEYEHRP